MRIDRNRLYPISGASNKRSSAKSGCVIRWLPLALVFQLLAATGHAQFMFETNNGALTVTKYTGSGGAVEIPSTTNGMPVTSISANVRQFVSICCNTAANCGHSVQCGADFPSLEAEE